VGTHPFYLQVVGEELCAEEPTEEISPLTLKIVLQRTLFDNTGRLNLYFQRLLNDIVGKSSSLESILLVLTEDRRIRDIARAIHVDSGTASNWLGRLLREDIVVKHEDGSYGIPDPAFKLWLQSRSDIQTVLPPLVLGSETEKLVARVLMAQGVRLVYHAQASRGPFDLLALMNGQAFGLQCKKADLPYYLPQEEHDSMQAWAEKLSWTPILALNIRGEIRFYRLDTLRATEKHYRVDDQTPSLKSLLALL
jgi:Holliday junction resolvase